MYNLVIPMNQAIMDEHDKNRPGQAGTGKRRKTRKTFPETPRDLEARNIAVRRFYLVV